MVMKCRREKATPPPCPPPWNGGGKEKRCVLDSVPRHSSEGTRTRSCLDPLPRHRGGGLGRGQSQIAQLATLLGQLAAQQTQTCCSPASRDILVDQRRTLRVSSSGSRHSMPKNIRVCAALICTLSRHTLKCDTPSSG